MANARTQGRPIGEELRPHAEALARELLPGGHIEGGEWRCGSLAGDPGRSLVVQLRGERAGHWNDYSSGEHGDQVGMIAETRTGGDRAAACRWGRDWVGRPTPIELPAPRAIAPVDRERYWTSERVLGTWWLPARPIGGTTGEIYLRDARGIRLERSWPAALRLRPAAYHRHSGRILPALVALVSDHEGQPAGVQATWLRPDGQTKADVTPPRKTYGPARGGAVRLAIPGPGSPLYVAEGVEDALSIMALLPGAACWATLGTSGLRALIVPPEIRDVRICCDADEPGREAAAALAKRLVGEGRAVRLVPPPIGKDWNDALRVRQAVAR